MRHYKTIIDCVCIAARENRLTCAIFQVQNNKRPELSLHAFKELSFNNFELEHLIVFNPTRIGSSITAFMTEHKIKNKDIFMSIDLPAISETLTQLSDDKPSKEFEKLVWQSIPIEESDPSMHYRCGIRREILFQYQLLAARFGLNLACLTTRTAALEQFKKLNNNDKENPHNGNSLEKLCSGLEAQKDTRESLKELIGIGFIGLDNHDKFY